MAFPSLCLYRDNLPHQIRFGSLSITLPDNFVENFDAWKNSVLFRATVQKFSIPIPVASPGFFSGGGTPRPLKGYHAPPVVLGGGAAAPRMVKFKILKQFKVLENESIFQKYQHF